MTTLLELKKLNFAYVKDSKILDNIDLILNQNKVYGLIGKNGAGKTTLIKTLSSVFNNNVFTLKYFKFFDKEVQLSSEFYRQNKYTVFTESESFLNWTFLQYLEMVCQLYNCSIERKRLEILVNGFKFEDYCQKEIRDLSTGNKKKVFLIVGLYLKRPLLILDEPFDGLDFESTEFLYKMLLEYKQYGTVLLSTHFAESVVRVCDYLYILENAHINLFQGNVSEWLESIRK